MLCLSLQLPNYRLLAWKVHLQCCSSSSRRPRFCYDVAPHSYLCFTHGRHILTFLPQLLRFIRFDNAFTKRAAPATSRLCSNLRPADGNDRLFCATKTTWRRKRRTRTPSSLLLIRPIPGRGDFSRVKYIYPTSRLTFQRITNRVSFGCSTPKPRAEALENLDTAGTVGSA